MFKVFTFKLKKICFGGKDPPVSGILEFLPSGGLIKRDVPTLVLYRNEIKGDSAGNCQLMDEEST
jgi:hypothetical protein